MMLHTLDLYNLSRRLKCRRLSAHMCRILPTRCLAVAIRIFTSVKHPPPASKTEPRYLFRHEFVVSHSPHFTFGIVFCSSFLFTSIASSTAVLVTLCILQWWWPDFVDLALACRLCCRRHIYDACRRGLGRMFAMRWSQA